MATNPKAECRLSLINHAYLKDLAKLGPYGKGKAGVMRRFIENGIKEALEKRQIALPVPNVNYLKSFSYLQLFSGMDGFA